MNVPCGNSLASVDGDHRLVHPAVVRLPEGSATVHRVLTDRWPLAAAALLDGTTPDDVSAAVGLTLSELRGAITRWASAQFRQGRLTENQHVQLVNTVFGPAGP